MSLALLWRPSLAPFVGVTSGSQDTPAGLELVTQRFGTGVATLVKHIVGVLTAGLRLKLGTLKVGVLVAENPSSLDLPLGSLISHLIPSVTQLMAPLDK